LTLGRHAFKDGTLKPTRVYVSKTAQIESDLPADAVGQFPSSKYPIRSKEHGDVRLRVAGKDL
jgi:hypothetical protein